MSYKEISYSNENEWHEIRRKHIGGSDVSIIMGYNEYKNPVTLWEEKTGRKKQDDLTQNEAVQRGNMSENLLIEHFKINNPGYSVGKIENSLENLQFPFMIANLDGTLEHKELGKGVLEIKTATCHSYAVYLDKWKTDIPIEYYLQIQHYLSVTNYNYAILYADIRLEYTEEKRHEIKQYFIKRNDEDINQIVEKEKEFYQYLVEDKQPPLIKKLIF